MQRRSGRLVLVAIAFTAALLLPSCQAVQVDDSGAQSTNSEAAQSIGVEPTVEPSPTPAPTATPTATPTTSPLRVEPIVRRNGSVVDSLAEAISTAEDGDLITLGTGRYHIASPLIITRDITIRGNQTTIRSAETGTMMVLVSNGITVEGLELTTSFEAAEDWERFDLLEINSAQDFLLRDLTIDGSLRNGISVQGDARGVVINTTISNSQDSGLSLGDQTAVDMHGVTSTNNKGAGFFWHGAATGLATGNSAQNNSLGGFVMADISSVDLRGNTATDNPADGFSWSGASTGHAVGNQSTNAQRAGFATYETSAPRLTTNVALSSGEVGIGLHDSSTPFVRGNRSAESTLSGFSISQQAQPVLTGNVSLDNKEAGFVWFNDSAGTATANVAIGNGIGGFYSTDNASPLWGGNDGMDNIGALLTSDSTAGNPELVPGTARAFIVDADDPTTGELSDATRAAKDGDTIYLTPGEHQLNRVAVVDPNATIIGAGRDHTLLLADTDEAFVALVSSGGIVHGFSIDGSARPESTPDKEAATMIFIDNSLELQVDDVVISDVGVRNAPAAGVEFFDSSAVVTGLEVTTSSGVGVLVSNSTVDLHTSVFVDNESSGIAVIGTSVGTVTTSESSDNLSVGFATQDDAEGVFYANTSGGNPWGFVWNANATGLAVGNMATRAIHVGFAAEDQSSPTWRGNTSIDHGGGYDFFAFETADVTHDD